MRPMMTTDELRKQAGWLKTQPGPKAQRAAELAEMAAAAQDRAAAEFVPDEVAAIRSAAPSLEWE